ncbi:ComF family protein [Geothermobacter ehrlichii]|uniref:ComF family protein n=1 Tax=Geothermobacter ehrlichii TaxID=213224 RepID=A0A5D3WJ63_9BACT|nr:ComF family protein [Geothermobacter ehrlichii]TYO96623.1 ComF family protein [Geothermobacter ehrlichii]
MRFHGRDIWKELCHAGRLLLPPVCPACAGPLAGEQTFCASCLTAITPLPKARCPVCALPYPATDDMPHLCGDCAKRRPPFAIVHAAGLYQGLLRELIHRLKYHAVPLLDRPLARLLAQALSQNGAGSPDLVLPVPLHYERLKKRTFNQAQLIARELARILQSSFSDRLLVRLRPTPPQQNLSAEQRRRNLRGAFGVQDRLGGRRVLLVDDVMTTGATARTCTEALLAAGAAEVEIAVAGRAARFLQPEFVQAASVQVKS